MKRLFIALCFILPSLISSAQTCEQREEKILKAMNGFSAGLLYNTYGIIGSIADAYGCNTYDETMLNGLMDAQKEMIENTVRMIENLKTENTITNQATLDYITSSIEIFKGLKKEAELLQEYAKNNNRKRKDAYEDQRKKDWSELSKLMGVKE